MITTLPVNGDERYEDVSGLSYMAIDQYYRELAWTEPLSTEEQERLFDRVARAKRFPENAHYALLARDARAQLVQQYQPLVLKMAKRVVASFQSMEVLDLVNEGSLGLLEAIDEYGDQSGFRGNFITLATLCIRHAFWTARTRQDGFVTFPARLRSLLSKMRKVSFQFERQHAETPTVSQLALLLQVSEAQIAEAAYFASREYAASLEQFAYEDAAAEERHDFVSLFQGEVMTEGARQAQLRQVFEQVLQQELTKRERQILEMRYGLCGPCAESLTEVAHWLGVSACDVQGLYRRAVDRLQPLLESLVSSSEDGCLALFPTQDYYTTKEVAALLQLGELAVTRRAARGKLPAQWSDVHIHNGNGQRRLLFPKQAIDALVSSSVSLAENYYTLKEVAALLGVGVSTVMRRVQQGTLRAEVRRQENGRQKTVFLKQALHLVLASADRETLPDLTA